MSDRRRLDFQRLDDVMPEVDRLLKGYRATGRWSLGQICKHLAGMMHSSVDGFAQTAPWVVRATVGPLAKRHVLRTGRMPEGIKLPKAAQPRPDLDARAEAEALRATIQQFARMAGPLKPHPFFGKLTVDEWTRLHAIHAAHHLGFLVPEPAPAPAPASAPTAENQR